MNTIEQAWEAFKADMLMRAKLRGEECLDVSQGKLMAMDDAIATLAKAGNNGGQGEAILAELDWIPKRVSQDICEIPDRNSPEDQPDMCLVTPDEIVNIVTNALEELRELLAASPTAPVAGQPDGYAAVLENGYFAGIWRDQDIAQLWAIKDNSGKTVVREMFYARPSAESTGTAQAAGWGGEWKAGAEFLPYHPDASHVPPEYRDGWNACYFTMTAISEPYLWIDAHGSGRISPVAIQGYIPLFAAAPHPASAESGGAGEE